MTMSIVIPLAIGFIVFCLLVTWVVRLKRSRIINYGVLIQFLVIQILLTGAITAFQLFVPFPYYSIKLVTGLTVAILPLLSLWLAGIGTNLNDKGTPVLPDLGDHKAINGYITALLGSGNLATAITATLPSGEIDRKYGLDYISFLLQRTELRRERFSRSSNRFLMLTIAMGFVFVGVMAYFGYVLVNEAAAGTPRLLSEVRQDASTLVANLDSVSTATNNKYFGEAVRTLKTLDGAPSDTGAVKQARSAIEEAEASGDARRLRDKLKDSLRQSLSEPALSKNFRLVLSSAIDDVEAVIARQAMMAQVRQSSSDLERLLPRLETSLQAPDNRIAEIIKRLALGLVVATFFLGILRYVAGIYQSHYRQMLLAEQEDQAIRRFYIGFKSSEDCEEQRRVVLESFLSQKPGNSGDQPDKLPDAKEELTLIKELMSLLSKKL